MSIKLDLTLDEVNGVLISLGKLPFEQVEPLITKVRGQAVPQAIRACRVRWRSDDCAHRVSNR